MRIQITVEITPENLRHLRAFLRGWKSHVRKQTDLETTHAFFAALAWDYRTAFTLVDVVELKEADPE